MTQVPISQFWDAEEVPAYVLDLCDSFRECNRLMPYRLFSESDAERFIATHFSRRELDAFRACAIPSMQSDYFRYCVVYVLGGIYADVDYRCPGPLSSLIDRIDGGELFSSPKPHIAIQGRKANSIWSGFFVFREPGHPFLRLALDLATANMEERISERLWPTGDGVIEAVWLTVGPGIPTFMCLLREWGSFDALIEAVAGGPAKQFVRLNCEVVGDYERILEAFDGVRISPHKEMMRWVQDPEFRLPYKDTDAHWHNATTRIFR